MNQGKRKDQIEFSEKMAGGSMLAMIIIILISWIWRIEQFNRNRSKEEQVSTIEEMENKVNEIFNS